MSVSEDEAKEFPHNPVRGDEGKADDQFGLRQEQVEELRSVAIQGSGITERP